MNTNWYVTILHYVHSREIESDSIFLGSFDTEHLNVTYLYVLYEQLGKLYAVC